MLRTRITGIQVKGSTFYNYSAGKNGMVSFQFAQYLTLFLPCRGKMNEEFLCLLLTLFNQNNLPNGELSAVPDLLGLTIVNYSLFIFNSFPTGFT